MYDKSSGENQKLAMHAMKMTGDPKAFVNKCECAYLSSNLYFALYSV